MNSQFGERTPEQRLDLRSLALVLNADGHLSDADCKRLGKTAIGAVHPLVYISEQKLADPSRDGRLLDMDALLAWLGGRTGQAVYDIDPLKINVGEVSEVMSQAFAERHHILAVEVNPDEVVIASAEPYLRAWESNLQHTLRKPIRRVLADPRAIVRHSAEFYTMAGSVRSARPF